jgi:putative Holliday junction resolvase
MAAMRYLGVDPGGQRIGIAVGDDVTSVVSPVAVIPNRGGIDAVAQRIAQLAGEHAARSIVVGLPTSVDGDVAPGATRSHRLAETLESLGWTVTLQAEHLTSVEARSRARECGRRAQQPVDDIAAQIILEEHLARRQATP